MFFHFVPNEFQIFGERSLGCYYAWMTWSNIAILSNVPIKNSIYDYRPLCILDAFQPKNELK
eukprot:TRINITY_DN16611_c0_g1_i1.p1 TRINITY_DN16611_c0_g1~~TRINITY_DN16611_c0_g1_i1.p1  ORF type:complete len:62 (-),score=2.95 TRINITY_DN16611_c0_g1_i1:122-307(-)